MQQKQDRDEGHRDRLFDQIGVQRAHHFINDVRAVVVRDELHRYRLSRWQHDAQAGFHLGDFFLQAIDDGQRVFAVAHQHHGSGRLAASVVERAAPELWTKLHRRHVLHIDRRASFLPDDDVLDVLHTANKTFATDEELVAIALDDLGSDVDVALADGFVNVGQGDAMCSQLFRDDVDLVLAHEAAERRDLGHTLDRLKLISNVPILQRPEFGEISPFRFQRVVEDLPQRRRVRSERRHHPLR